MKTDRLALLSLYMLLAGCGGSNDGVTSTPPPPPPATPLPLAANSSFDTLTSALAFSGQTQSYSDGLPVGGDAKLTDFLLSGRTAALTFSYDKASGTYTVQGSGGSASFGAGDRKADIAYTNIYAKAAGTTSDELTLFGNARSDTAGNAPVALSYTSFGFWVHTDSAANLTSRTYFLYGQPTGAANMPTTGSATYQMVANAQIFGTNFAPATLTAVSGTATMTANFGSGTVSTALTIRNGVYNGTGTIGADQFTGSFTSNVGGFTGGNFAGGFFGPSAKEAGYVFHITAHNDPYAGAAIQPADTYITGVAIGAAGSAAQAPQAARQAIPVVQHIAPPQGHASRF